MDKLRKGHIISTEYGIYPIHTVSFDVFHVVGIPEGCNSKRMLIIKEPKFVPLTEDILINTLASIYKEGQTMLSLYQSHYREGIEDAIRNLYEKFNKKQSFEKNTQTFKQNNYKTKNYELTSILKYLLSLILILVQFY